MELIKCTLIMEFRHESPGVPVKGEETPDTVERL